MEAAIVQDADRLDALGAIGIARLWIVAAELGSDFYHPDDPMAENRPLERREICARSLRVEAPEATGS
ncbi:MAG: hypothetical protein R2849_17245 [Thermomicrobiales bacterium]